MEDVTWSGGNLRLAPYTRDSLTRQEARCRSARLGLRGKDRSIALPECECVHADLLPKDVLYTPLEDVGQFGYDKTFCVIAPRSDSYYLYRYSSEDSLFLFSPWSSFRRFAIRISCHRFFELFVMTTILLNCVFLALSQPIEETEYVFLAIYTAEMLLKVVAKGFILNRYSYLRNPWNWLDFIVVVAGYITLGLQAIGVAIGNLSGLRTFRVLRALKTVSITPGLKTIVNAMLHSLGMLAEVMTLTVFCLMVFALLALQLYVGVLRHKCVLNGNASYAHDRSRWLMDTDGQPVVCGNRTGARKCPESYTCLPGIGDNPNFGYTNFDTYGWSLLTTFQLITLDFWEDVYNKVNAATGPTSVFFFMLVVFFGSFYLINLTLAVVAIAYEEEATSALREKDKIKRLTISFPNRLYSTLLALKARTNMLRPSSSRQQSQRWCSPRRGAGIVPRSPPPLRIQPQRNELGSRITCTPFRITGRIVSPGEPLHQEEEEDEDERSPPDIIVSAGDKLPPGRRKPATPRRTIHVFDDSSQRGASDHNLALSYLKTYTGQCGRFLRSSLYFLSRGRRYLSLVVSDPIFETLITICIILNTGFLSFEHYGMSSRTERILKLGNLVFTVIFTLEAAAKLLALGYSYFSSRWNLFDLVVVLLSLADLSFETVGGLSVLRTFRLLRVVKLAQAWSTMRLLLAIIASTLGAVGNMTLVLAVIVYVFAIVGVQLFQDIYSDQNFAPQPVPRWNFKDFVHSLLMVFRILCGEWVQPLWECMRAAGERHHLCVVLFLAALTVGNFLVLNLFLAMLLNSFNSQELQDKKDRAPSDSKILKGLQRIKGVIKKDTAPVQPESQLFDKPRFPRSPVFYKRRRWSEPGITMHSLTTRRVSDVSIDKFRLAGEAPGTFSSVKILTVSNNIFPPVDTIEEEPHSGEDVSTPKKDKDSTGNTPKEPPECCPICLCRQCNMDDRPFFRHWIQIRRAVLIVVDHRAFEWTILVFICCSSVVLCFEDYYLPERPKLQRALGYLNLFFTGCFVLEVLMKWVAYGLTRYFGNLWTTLDFAVVCVSVASVVAESSGSGLYALRAFRTLRALRPLRAISRWQGMKIVVNALMSAIPAIFNVLLVCLVFWLIFGIMGVQFFGGRFYRCVDSTTGKTLSHEVSPDVGRCLALNHSWINRDINFDNVGNAYLALFQVATFEGWTEVMEYAADATDVGVQPRTEANLAALIYFVVFIICGSFFTLNLFIGVIIDNFNMLKKRYEGSIVEMFLTESQRAYYTAMLKLGRRKPQRIVTRPQNRYLRICYDVAMSRKFEMLVFLLIILNMVVMTVEHYQQPEEVTKILEALNIAFTALFTAEAIVKIIGLRQYFFTFPWNIFDLIVIILSIIGIIFEEALQQLVISPTLLRVVRLVRITRILRLIRAAKGIRRLLFALVISLPALFNIGALLFLVTFVYAIVGMSLFGQAMVPDPGRASGLSPEVNFRTFASSMLLLFRLATSAGWNDVLEDLAPQRHLAIVYLVTYIIINFMVIINMYIAVILENLSEAGKEETGVSEEDIDAFYTCWSRFDPSATQFIPCDQLSEFVASLDPPLGIEYPNAPALVAMDLPIASGDRIHCLDVLHGLVSLVLGDVEDTEEFRAVRRNVDRRFRKTFPTRHLVEIVSSTAKRKQQDNAAKVIQRTYKQHLLKKKEVSIKIDDS